MDCVFSLGQIVCTASTSTLLYILFIFIPPPPAESGLRASYLIRFLLLPMIRSVLSNMFEMEHYLKKTEEVNWTVVRPPGLKNLPATGKTHKRIQNELAHIC